MATAQLDGQFEHLIQTVQSDVPPDLQDQICAGLKKRYANPLASELTIALGRNTPIPQAQLLWFFPDAECMSLYPQLLTGAPPGAPGDHPLAKLQIVALTQIYLLHSHTWAAMRTFVEAGGLRPLISILAHKELILASQALEILCRVMNENVYPWHSPPLPEGCQRPQDGPDSLLYKRMFEFTQAPLIPNLLRHFPSSFPGSSAMALRVLAFFLSLSRCHFTKDGQLKLSQKLLDTLQQWSIADGIQPDERGLAHQLYEEFSKAGPAAEPEHSTNESDMKAEWDDDGLVVTHDRTQINAGMGKHPQAEALKQLGNTAYQEGRYSQAIQHYSAALDWPVPMHMLLDEGKRRAIYHLNRAAAYLARAEAGQLREGEMDMSGPLEGLDHGEPCALTKHYEAALLDCDAAIGFDSSLSKAHYRRAMALKHLGRLEEAHESAHAAVVQLMNDSRPGDVLAAAQRLESELAAETLKKQMHGKAYDFDEMD